MKQVFQDLKNGKTIIADVPAPKIGTASILVETNCSLISPGTEKMLRDFGKASYLSKAKQQPEKVAQVLDKVKTDGIIATYESVVSKLNEPIPLGYCNVGKVVQATSDVNNIKVGDRIVSNGYHAEIVSVGKNLCAKIPHNVSDEQAAFTVIGSIALQSVRLTAPTIGETFVVAGLGIVGLFCVQLLRANGCRVIALDFDDDRLKKAESYGAKVIKPDGNGSVVDFIMAETDGVGCDGVIIAAATSSDTLISQSARMCRKRGRIVLVGVCGLNLKRDDFFKKEITFQVSASYGPGRYDPLYEESGQDYPIGFVRWTEQRNFEAVLMLMSEGKLNTDDLISHRFSIEEAIVAYESLDGKSLGILLSYPKNSSKFASQLDLSIPSAKHTATELRVGFVGTGNYARRHLIKAFAKNNAKLQQAGSRNGRSSWLATLIAPFEEMSTNVDEVIESNSNNTIVISTNHNTHADFLIQSLKNGKNVFLEKPLAINIEQQKEIENFLENDWDGKSIFTLGYNRRFSPVSIKIKEMLVTQKEPAFFIMNINAGTIPKSSWVRDKEIGGGRIIGELCHFIDYLLFLSGSNIKNYTVTDMSDIGDESCSVNLQFENGAQAILNYFTNGPKNYPKETLDIFVSGKSLKLNNFKSLTAKGWTKFTRQTLPYQNKGQNECVKAFCEAIRTGGQFPISIKNMLQVSNICIQINDKLN